MDLINCIFHFIFRLLAEIGSSHVQLTCIHHCDASTRCPSFEDYKFSKVSSEVKEKEVRKCSCRDHRDIMKPGCGDENTLGLLFGLSRTCDFETPLGYSSLSFIHWAGINRDSLSPTRGSQCQDQSVNYFDIIGTVPPIANHSIWGCLHFLPLVLNIFLA